MGADDRYDEIPCLVVNPPHKDATGTRKPFRSIHDTIGGERPCTSADDEHFLSRLNAHTEHITVGVGSGAPDSRGVIVTIDPKGVIKMAADYTAAWNSGSPEAVASFYASDGHIVINAGAPWVGRQSIAEMAAGFYADVPDLKLVCDEVRCAGDHAAYFWTFTGTHASTNNPLRVVGWEEWDLNAELKVVASRGWYDAADYERQTTSR